MSLLQRLYTAPLLWIGVLVLLGYFACSVMWAIHERYTR